MSALLKLLQGTNRLENVYITDKTVISKNLYDKKTIFGRVFFHIRNGRFLTKDRLIAKIDSDTQEIYKALEIAGRTGEYSEEKFKDIKDIYDKLQKLAQDLGSLKSKITYRSKEDNNRCAMLSKLDQATDRIYAILLMQGKVKLDDLLEDPSFPESIKIQLRAIAKDVKHDECLGQIDFSNLEKSLEVKNKALELYSTMPKDVLNRDNLIQQAQSDINLIQELQNSSVLFLVAQDRKQIVEDVKKYINESTHWSELLAIYGANKPVMKEVAQENINEAAVENTEVVVKEWVKAGHIMSDYLKNMVTGTLRDAFEAEAYETPHGRPYHLGLHNELDAFVRSEAFVQLPHEEKAYYLGTLEELIKGLEYLKDHRTEKYLGQNDKFLEKIVDFLNSNENCPTVRNAAIEAYKAFIFQLGSFEELEQNDIFNTIEACKEQFFDFNLYSLDRDAIQHIHKEKRQQLVDYEDEREAKEQKAREIKNEEVAQVQTKSVMEERQSAVAKEIEDIETKIEELDRLLDDKKAIFASNPALQKLEAELKKLESEQAHLEAKSTLSTLLNKTKNLFKPTVESLELQIEAEFKKAEQKLLKEKDQLIEKKSQLKLKLKEENLSAARASYETVMDIVRTAALIPFLTIFGTDDKTVSAGEVRMSKADHLLKRSGVDPKDFAKMKKAAITAFVQKVEKDINAFTKTIELMDVVEVRDESNRIVRLDLENKKLKSEIEKKHQKNSMADKDEAHEKNAIIVKEKALIDLVLQIKNSIVIPEPVEVSEDEIDMIIRKEEEQVVQMEQRSVALAAELALAANEIESLV